MSVVAAAPVRDTSSRIEWRDEPVALSLKDYQQLKAGFIRKVSGVPGVRAVYEHRASAYELGLSDIDLIVVCDDALPRGSPERLVLNWDAPHAHDIYRGGPVIIPASLFREPVLAPHWELRVLDGAPQDRRTIDAVEHRAARIMVAVEQSGHNAMSFARRQHTNRWSAKVTLGLLKGLLHNYGACREMNEWPAELRQWREAVLDLRQRWCSMDPERLARLEALTREGMQWVEWTCWDMARRLHELDWLGDGLNRPVALPAGHQVMVFANHLEEAQASAPRGIRTPVLLPALHYVEFAETVACATGSFQRMLRTLAKPKVRAGGSLHFRGVYAGVLRRRIELQQAWYEFLRRHGLKGNGCEGAWWTHLDTPSDGVSLARQLRRRLGFTQQMHRPS
jgi:hypothetical protein